MWHRQRFPAVCSYSLSIVPYIRYERFCEWKTRVKGRQMHWNARSARCVPNRSFTNYESAIGANRWTNARAMRKNPFHPNSKGKTSRKHRTCLYRHNRKKKTFLVLAIWLLFDQFSAQSRAERGNGWMNLGRREYNYLIFFIRRS